MIKILLHPFLTKKILFFSSLILLSYNVFAQIPCNNLVPEGNFESVTCSSIGTSFTLPGYSCNTSLGPGFFDITDGLTLYSYSNDYYGSANGGVKMLFVDLLQTPGTVWQKTLTVQPNTPYTFSTYVRNAVEAGHLYSLPNIILKIDGIQVASSGPLQEGSPWQLLQSVWTSPCNVSGPIQIEVCSNSSNPRLGSDFCLDDLSFINCPTVTPPMPTLPVTCVSRCGTGSLTLMATGACDYRWYNVPSGGTPISTSSQIVVNLAAKTTDYYWVSAVNSQGAESSRQYIKAISDPIRTWITTSTPALCAGSLGSYTIHIQNLDCLSHNLSVFPQVSGPGNFTQTAVSRPFGNVAIPPGQIISYYVDGNFSMPGNYIYTALVTDLTLNCPANAELAVNVAKGDFIIEGYVDGVCTEDVIYLTSLGVTSSNMFQILNENLAVQNTCTTTNGTCNMLVPTTPGVYTVRNTAVIGSCTIVTSKPLHVFGKNRDFIFDGNDDRITATHEPAYSDIEDKDFTLEAWVNINPSVTGSASLIAMGDWHQDGFVFETENGGTSLAITIAGQISQSQTFTSIHDDFCHHVAVSRTDDGAISFYVDGVDQSSGGNNAGVINSSGDLVFGIDGMAEKQFLNGRLDEVRFWNVYRSRTQIDDAKSLRTPDNFGDVIGYWPMNENNSQILLDYSMTSNDVVLGNDATPENEDPQVNEEACLSYCPDSEYRAANKVTQKSKVTAKGQEFEVLLSPNPFTSESTLKVTGIGFETFQVLITATSGQQVFQKQAATGESIVLGKELKPGLYFVQLITPSGYKTLKLIKQ